MASSLIRLMAPGNGRGPTSSHSGKQVSTTAGTFLDLPDNSADLNIYTANGWVKIGYVGTTANRRENQPIGTKYVDTTLSKIVVFDGIAWRDPVSGSAV